MLILTRRVGETFQIGDDITVVVLGFKGNQIRLGIKAPPNKLVLRTELLERGDHKTAPAAADTAS